MVEFTELLVIVAPFDFRCEQIGLLNCNWLRSTHWNSLPSFVMVESVFNEFAVIVIPPFPIVEYYANKYSVLGFTNCKIPSLNSILESSHKVELVGKREIAYLITVHLNSLPNRVNEITLFVEPVIQWASLQSGITQMRIDGKVIVHSPEVEFVKVVEQSPREFDIECTCI